MTLRQINHAIEFGNFDFGQQPQFPKPKTGMFGSGSGKAGDIIQALLGGFLAARGNPAGMAALQSVYGRRNQRDEEAQHAQRREEEFQDFVRKESYKAANPGPTNNDTVADYNFRVQTLGKEAADEWLRNPPQYMNVPGVGLVQIPRQGPQMGAPAAPGVTFTPLDGGPTPQASGGFPRPY